MTAQQFTPWQKMKAFERHIRRFGGGCGKKEVPCECQENDPNVIYAEPFDYCVCKAPLTYYNNGKCNQCGKVLYDYNFFYCLGYDQYLKRDDRKHAIRYMNIDIEEEFPCRKVTLRTSSNYGHRCPIDPMKPIPKNHWTKTFYRHRGTSYCIDANGYWNVNLQPTTSFKWNAQFGYTYAPPRGM